MNYIAIAREGDSAEINIRGRQEPVILGEEEPNFVKSCTIVFVGMCTIHRGNDRIVLYSLPKYFPKEKCNIEHLDEIKSHLRKICQVVEKLRSEGRDFDDAEYLFEPYEQGCDSKYVNRWELAEYIIEDYAQNGLYVKDLTEIVRGGVGRTNWSKTISKIDPCFQSDTPMYLERMNKHHIINENDIMSIIHANVVNQCIDFANMPMSDGMEYVETEPLGENLSMYAAEINSRITYVFKERDINLFKALEAWCQNTRFYKNYAGVTCFNRVWEWVNDSVWGNMKHPKSGNPIYHIGDTDYEGYGEAIPDTIRIEPNGESNYVIYIFDSKYYTIESIEKRKINGWPNNSDIAKQVAYLKLIKSQYGEGDYFNSFLLPETIEHCGNDGLKDDFMISENEWFRCLGYVEPGEFSFFELNSRESNLQEWKSVENDKKREENKVSLIFVKPNELYNRYLAGYNVGLEELKNATGFASK